MVTETVKGSENTSWELEDAHENITAEDIRKGSAADNNVCLMKSYYVYFAKIFKPRGWHQPQKSS